MNSQKIIKKVFLSIFSVFILAFTGCGTQASVRSSSYQAEYLPEEDYNYQSYTWEDETQRMVSSTEGCYFLAEAYLFFMDWNTMQSVPLCFKTDCLHTEETNPQKVPLCDAYMGNWAATTPFLGLYQEKLYTICIDRATAKHNLVEMNQDGSNRKILYSLSSNNSITDIFMHRGVIYFAADLVNLQGESYYGLNALSVISNSHEPVQVYTGAFENGFFQDIFAYQNFIFIRDCYAAETSFVGKTMKYDIRTGESEEIIEDHYYMYGIEGDDLLLHHNSGLYYVYSIKDKKMLPSQINDYPFVQEHSQWQFYCENSDEDIAWFACFDMEALEPVADAYIVNSLGEVITVIPNAAWDLQSRQIIERDGEKYFFQYYADDSIIAYAKSDLLQGMVNPITILDVSDYGDLCPGIIIKTGE